jgi:DNA repair protein RecO (recombination protein O)
MEVICYKAMPYRDNSKILFVYSKEGKYSLVDNKAYSMKNPYKIVSQPFTKFEIEKPKKKMSSLNVLSITDNYLIQKQDLAQTKLLSNISYVLDSIVSDIDSPEDIYDLLSKSLDMPIDIGVLYFLLRITSLIGYQMNLIKDDYTDIIGFSIEKGDLVEGDEMYKVDYKLEQLVSVLKIYYNTDTNSINSNELKFVRQFVKKYYNYHLDIELVNMEDIVW